jgi:trk system potassium uptake protein TrkH
LSFRTIARLLGAVLLLLALSMALPLAWSIHFSEAPAIRAFFISIAVTAVAGGVLMVLGRGRSLELRRRDGLAVVSLSWILAAAFGALPFLLSGALPTYVDCFFEAMSGFTTTGSSVMTNIEATAKGVLFWRDFTQWLGGMGIIVLFIAILPSLGVGGRHLFASEIPGAIKDGLRPRVKDTALLLWEIYFIISLAEVLLLQLQGVSLFESLCHTFGTMATGGFSPLTASVGAYKNPMIEMTVLLFMVLAGTNFSLYFLVLRRRPSDMLGDPEWRVYISVIALACVLVAAELLGRGVYKAPHEALRYSSFQVVSIMTTTGFMTANFDAWPAFSRLLLVALMFLGACSGSTGGGMKVLRAIVLVKYAYHVAHKVFRPQAVFAMRVGKVVIRDDVVRDIVGFFIIFTSIFLLASLAMAAMGLDIITATTSVAATMGNIGPGLGGVGPTQHFAFVPVPGKILLSICMLLGRLELYTVLALVVPAFWRE